MAKLSYKTEYRLTVSDQNIWIPSDVLETILINLPFNQFPQMKFVCSGFNKVVDRVFDHHPELYGMAVPKIAYTPDMAEADDDLDFARLLVPVGEDFPHHHVVRRFVFEDTIVTGGLLQHSPFTVKPPIFAKTNASTIKVFHPNGQPITELTNLTGQNPGHFSLRPGCVSSLSPCTVVTEGSEGSLHFFRFETNKKERPAEAIDTLVPIEQTPSPKQCKKEKKSTRFRFFRNKKKKPVSTAPAQITPKEIKEERPDPATRWPNVISPEIKLLMSVSETSLDKDRLIEEKMPTEHYRLSDNGRPFNKIVRINANNFMSVDCDGIIKYWNTNSRSVIQTWDTSEKDEICALSYYDAKSVIYATYAKSLLNDHYRFAIKRFDGINKTTLFWHTVETNLGKTIGSYEFHLTPNYLAFISAYSHEEKIHNSSHIDFRNLIKLSVIHYETDRDKTTFYQTTLGKSFCYFFLPSGHVGHFHQQRDKKEESTLEVTEFLRLQRLREEPTNTLMFSPTTFSQ